MSAWPEAVWIVKKLQKNFDFTSELNYYTTLLNDLNSRINTLIDRVNTDETNISSRTVTFVSTATNGVPTNPPTNYGVGTLWLVSKS